MIYLPLIVLSACAFFSLFGLVLAVYSDKHNHAINALAVTTFLFGLSIMVVSA